MIITGKRGTELEGIFKLFYEQMNTEQETLSQMIKEFSSVEPIEVRDKAPVCIRKGYSCLWDYDYIRFQEGCEPLNMVSRKEGEVIYHSPNRCLESSKKFMRKWHRLFKGINGNLLGNFGIPIVLDYVSYKWKPIAYDTKYGIEVSDNMKKYLLKIKSVQYEIVVAKN